MLVWSIFGTSFRNAPHEVKSLSPNQGKIQTKKKKKKKKLFKVKEHNMLGNCPRIKTWWNVTGAQMVDCSYKDGHQS